MRFPSKLFPYEESVLSHFPTVLSIVKADPISVFKLYQQLANKVENVAEFVEVLDALFILHKIDLNSKTGDLYYVG